MFARLGNFVSRHWLFVILFWLVLLVGLRLTAPRWDDVTLDGDFAYLPDDRPSVQGERLLSEAFPHDRAKSQVVLFTVREDGELTNDDIFVAVDLARRSRNLLGARSIERGKQLAREAAELRKRGDAEAALKVEQRSQAVLQRAADALDEAIRLDEQLAAYRVKRNSSAAHNDEPDVSGRLAGAYHNRALLHDYLGETNEAAAERSLALSFDPRLAQQGDRVVPEAAAKLPLLDVWTWHDDVIGSKLISKDKRARLVMLQLANEFLAVESIDAVDAIESELHAVRRDLASHSSPGLIAGISGSAVVGRDLLRSAKESINNTELFSILLVVLILVLVYRSPLLVAVPLITIVVSLMVATSTVALLTQLNLLPGFGWWHFKVFTTTKIFIVVILFGAGTDFCLFLIARYREELKAGLERGVAVAAALSAVGDALAASALTTIVGLGMMYFSEFGKFRYSGPAIGLCLAVTLLACVTLTPALLRAFGGVVFWPFGMPKRNAATTADNKSSLQEERQGDIGRFDFLWHWAARKIVAYPGRILIVSLLLLFPLAGFALRVPPFSPANERFEGTRITYDVLSELAPTCPSRQGTDILRRHFPVGESGPVIVLAVKENGRFDTLEGRNEIDGLAQQLFLPDVSAVRSIVDPLGDYRPGEKIGLATSRSWRTRMMRPHKLTEEIFVAQSPGMAGNIARFDLVVDYDPFSIEAVNVLTDIDRKLHAISSDTNSYWHDATFAYAGTTAAIRDLRAVTQSDTVRIEVLVVLAVSAVLLVILKRPVICLYMVVSVLFSYYVTIGATELFFQWAYGETFHGLDWKVPLFLFVILVAIGQDYNVYLATRVFEEQERLGPMSGLRRAIVRTGGIITSCGVIMAGTFISMTSGTWGAALPDWLPLKAMLFGSSAGALRGIVEIGFALSLGVLLDTFVVRPVLLPAFLVLLSRDGEGLGPRDTLNST
jgi:RND superfamily putative drug exporter